jgi:hypothetical protein
MGNTIIGLKQRMIFDSYEIIHGTDCIANTRNQDMNEAIARYLAGRGMKKVQNVIIWGVPRSTIESFDRYSQFVMKDGGISVPGLIH